MCDLWAGGIKLCWFVVVSGQVMKAVDVFEKSLITAVNQFVTVLHRDLLKAAVSSDTLLRVGRQQSSITAKASSARH